jgi:hypothetical protein
MDCGRGRSSGWALICETCSHRAAQFLLRHIIADSVNVRISAWRPKPNPLLAAVCMGLGTLSGFARLVPPKDPLDGVLDAQLVVIVRQWPVENSKLFKIEEAFLGDARKGSSIDLDDFELSTVQQYGPPVVEPITPETRILLFLKCRKDSPAVWEPTYFKESFFWVKRPGRRYSC